jgi:hypothetical protein
MSRLTDFVNASNARLQDFYDKNPNVKKFKHPERNSSTVQERMMRVGVEVRYCGVSSEDAIFEIAVATLQNDYVRHRMEEKADDDTRSKIPKTVD